MMSSSNTYTSHQHPVIKIIIQQTEKKNILDDKNYEQIMFNYAVRTFYDVIFCLKFYVDFISLSVS